MNRTALPLSLFVALLSVPAAAELPPADELLDRAIAYHDPEGLFLSQTHQLSFLETRPGGPDRETEARIDVAGGRFEIVRRGEAEVAGVIGDGRCVMTLDGRSEVSEEEREKYRLGCDRLELLRDYYTYLWGLPMKLRDPGTRLGPVTETRFADREVLGLRVTYDPEVGGDVWYFYFDPESFALTGYRFYHDEAKGDGEYIVLDGELEASRMRLPKRRAWYTHQGDRHLGTDTLTTLEGWRTRMRIVAGTGEAGFADGAEARFNKPIRLAPWGESSVLVADIYNHAIRIVGSDGEVSTLAGRPDAKGHRDGAVAEARFASPHGVAVSPAGRIAIAEAEGHTVRLIARSDGGLEVSTLAGVPGEGGYQDGPAAQALFSSPHAVVWLDEDRLLVADIGNARLRLIADGEVRTVAGTGEKGADDGGPGVATLTYPMDLALGAGGMAWIADAGSHLIRRWSEASGVDTLSLSRALSTPHGIAAGTDGTLYLAEMGAHRVVAVGPEGGTPRPVCGTGEAGGGPDQLDRPAAVLVHAGLLWIADLGHHRIAVVPLTGVGMDGKARAARKVAYGETIVHSGPVYRALQVRSTRMVIAFDHAGGGLVAKGSPEGRLKGFTIAGDDRRFVRAEAAFEGDRVAVWSDLVPAPVAVRYAWADNPEGANLYNREGLPASPFRTDDWPVQPAKSPESTQEP